MTKCYYHPDKLAIFQIPAEGGGLLPVCVRCHAKNLGEKEKK